MIWPRSTDQNETFPADPVARKNFLTREDPISTAVPERIHLSLSPLSRGVELELASRRLWPLGIFFGAFFAGFAWIALGQVGMIGGSAIEDIFDLTFVLFQAFWVLGWSVGGVILLAITVLLLFYDESARLTSDRLVYAPRLGPLHVLMDYDLNRIRNLRLEEPSGNSGDSHGVRIRFDYRGGTVSLGNDMPRPAARRVVRAIEEVAGAGAAVTVLEAAEDPATGGERSAGRASAEAAKASAGDRAGAPELPGVDVTEWLRRIFENRLGAERAGAEKSDLSGSAVAGAPGHPGPDERSAGAAPPEGDAGPQGHTDPPGWTSASVLALLLANLVPLLGVVGLGWDLGEVMVLFWAESGIIGFYSLLRLCYVAGWSAIVLGPFFLAHFGGFMAGHFLFIYALFIQGIESDGTVTGAGETGVLETLGDIFVPLSPALLALFLSHGVSFFTNFLRRREYAGRDPSEQMKEPYRRVVVMHVTIIFGGWLILALGTPTWALVLLLALKTAVDLAAHRREHSGKGAAPVPAAAA